MIKYFSIILLFFLTSNFKIKSTAPIQNADSTTNSDSLFFKKVGLTHRATWYNPHGAKTASGLRFHKDSLTCAYNFSPFGTLLKVTNTTTGLSVIVKVTDRMGIKSKNHIDLSKCAFDSIANIRSGVVKVEVFKKVK